MWKIGKLKTEAKRTFGAFGYWMPFLTSLVYGIIYSGLSTGGSGVAAKGAASAGGSMAEFSYSTDPEYYRYYLENLASNLQELWQQFLANPIAVIGTSVIVILTIVACLLVTYGWKAFIADPITVGKNRYFMEHRAFPTKITRLFFAFQGGRYWNIVKIMFFMELRIFLWSLLFIIPGIIKSYEYRMIPYILAENPQIPMERAFALSREMTKGEKLHIFGLDLSFIGWEILASLCCCVGGMYFLNPYIYAVNAELYEVMREKAHGTGFSDFAELPGFRPEQA